MRLSISVFLLLIFQVVFGGSIEYLPVPAKDIVSHQFYKLSYNEQKEQANWVYYNLTDSMVLNSGEERSNSFKIDRMVVTGSAKSSDYTKSGYDRGHLCPAADMGFSKVAMDETFYMSNISPQIPDFNRGIWKELESKVREWTKKEHEMIIVTGPVFKDNKGFIGKDSVTVPGYFYKIIFDITDHQKLIAFLIPNEKTEKPLTEFATTTDEIEKLTGYDFFSQLPDKQEEALENNVELYGWFDGYEPSNPNIVKTEDSIKPDINFYLILIIVVMLVIVLVYLKGRRRKY